MAGWTKTPNEIYAAMAGMSEAELRVTLTVVRMTYGYQKDKAHIEYEDFMIHGGLKSRGSVSKGIKLMLKRGFFVKGEGRSDYHIGTPKSTVSVLFGGEESTPDGLFDNNEQPKSTVNELGKSTVNELGKSTVNVPPSIYKEKKKDKEIEKIPFKPVKQKSKHPPSPADERVAAILAVCGLDDSVPAHLRQAQNAAAQLSRYTAADILKRYQRTENPNGTWYWYRDDWRGKQGQQPAPAQVVECIGKKVMAGQGQKGRVVPAPDEERVPGAW